MMWPGPVDLADIHAWCVREQDGAVPVDYEFFAPERQRELCRRWLVRAEAGDAGTNEGSGTAELIFSRDERRYLALESLLLRDDDAIDGRLVDQSPREQNETSPLITEYRTALRPDRKPISVIGPGGCVRAFRDKDRTFVDVTIRRRKAPIPAEWRSPEEVLADRAILISPRISIRGTFGYLEASKYDRQDLIRLVYLFVIDREPDEEDGLGWRTIIVEPATRPYGLPVRAGLESWSSGLP